MIPLYFIFLLIAIGGVFLGILRSSYNIRSETDSSSDKAILFWFIPFTILAVIFAALRK
jgi:hypothetical protein